MTWTFLGPLIGVVMGWGLTLFTSYINFYRSDKRTIREILYFLLELYRQVSSIYALETIMDDYFKKKEIEHAELKENQAYQQIVKLVKKIFLDKYYPEVENELNGLGNKYEECLIKIAAIDPIIAHRLKGKDKLISFLTRWKSQLEPKVDEKEIEAFKFLMASVELENPTKRLMNDFLKNLKTIISDVASKISKKTQKDIGNLSVFHASNPEDKDLENKLDMLMNLFIMQLKQQQAQNQDGQGH